MYPPAGLACPLGGFFRLPEFELAAEPPDDGVDGTLAPLLLLPAPPPPDAPLACCPLTVDGPTPVINR